jgi:DNA-binding transcriptional LysR family regulator
MIKFDHLRIAGPLSFGTTHLAPVFAELGRHHPLLSMHASYSDRFVDLVGEGFDCAVRVGLLADSNLIARRIGPIHGRLVASPDYIKEDGAPETPDELLMRQALMQGTEAWPLIDGKRPLPSIRRDGSRRTTASHSSPQQWRAKGSPRSRIS